MDRKKNESSCLLWTKTCLMSQSCRVVGVDKVTKSKVNRG